MSKEKRTILIVKIKEPGKEQRIIEAELKGGWSDEEIKKFVKGVKSGYPKDTKITTSTISKA